MCILVKECVAVRGRAPDPDFRHVLPQFFVILARQVCRQYVFG